MKSVRLEIPDDVHRSLKAKAALAGKPMKEYLTEIFSTAAKQRGSSP